MNRIHRLVWSAARHGWQVVSETASASGKSGPGGVVRRATRAASALAVLCAAGLGSLAWAGPQGGQITLGSGSVVQAGAMTTITQTSQQLALDWASFSVGAGETVRFLQPNAQSVALNRVLGTDPSSILGRLSANGQVFLLNPNGVLFGASAQVDVGGLVASTLSLSNADFAAGRLQLQGGGTAGSVSNAGRITAAEGGYVVLAAPQVKQTGDITTRLGSTVLAAGEHVTLQLQGSSLLGYRIERGALNALVEQAGRITADGGAVLVEAKALDALSTSVVNHTGVIQARTVQAREGRIVLLGDLGVGRTQVSGTLDASAPEGGNGGFIETSAAVVKVDETARVTTRSSGGKTGTWLIDPTDFTVAASGGDISGTALSAALANNNVTLDSTQGLQTGLGNLYVRDEVSWSSNRLTLRAQANIHIYRDLLGSGNAQLALEFGQATADGAGSDYDLHNASRVNLPEGRNFSIRQGSAGVTQQFHVVTRIAPNGVPGAVSYREINNDTAGLYALGADLSFDPNVQELKLRVGLEGQGGEPDFTGQFHGLGHTITGLTTSGRYAGMFDILGASAVARDFGLLGGARIGRSFPRGASNSSVGAVAGWNFGLIYKVYATPILFSRDAIFSGGLVGVNFGVIRQSFADPTGNTLPPTSIYASIGSLVGYNVGLVEDSFAYSRLAGSPPVIGDNDAGDARRVYAINPGYQVIDNNTTRNLDLAAMQSTSSFVGWDIGTHADGESIWRMYEGQSTPLLRDLRRRVDRQTTVTYNGQTQVDSTASGRNVGVYAASSFDTTPLGQEITSALVIEAAPLSVSSTDVSREFDGTTNAPRAQAQVVSGTLFGTDMLLGGRFAFADANAGTGKTVLSSDIRLSDGNGGANYLLTLVDNTTSTITPVALQVRVDRVNKTYDGTTDASTTWRFSSGRLYGSDSLSNLRFQFDTADVGTGKSLILTNAVIQDGNGGNNYTVVLTSNAASRILPAELFVAALDDLRVAGGQPYTGGNGFTTRGWVAGEDDRLLQGTVQYGGSSQGAVTAGSYRIAPSGLSSANYNMRFEDGVLVISAQPPVITPPVITPPGVPTTTTTPPLLFALPALPRLPDDVPRTQIDNALATVATGSIAIVDCGMRLPLGVPGDDCR